MIAKAVLGLLDAGRAGRARSCAPASSSARATGRPGWGAGLTVLTAMANVLPALDEADRALALVHGLAFVSRDTRGRAAAVPARAVARHGARATLAALVPPVRRHAVGRRGGTGARDRRSRRADDGRPSRT